MVVKSRWFKKGITKQRSVRPPSWLLRVSYAAKQ
nr:MAG TPA: hypothetical protein [Caudoviricetes sp.]